MRSDRQLPAQRLLDGGRHGLHIARVSAAGDVDRSQKRHQGFLRAIVNRFRRLPHIAIQVDGFHPRIESSEASSFSCSINNARASSISTRSNRTSSRGRNWPTDEKSAEITFAITG